jgi:hypothetical protein
MHQDDASSFLKPAILIAVKRQHNFNQLEERSD